MKITTLIENHAGNTLKNEHGLSLFIEAQRNYIFDTGQSSKFLDNIQTLNINLESVSDVIISHNHYDHAGGLLDLQKKITFTLHISKNFFETKYKKNQEEYIFHSGNAKPNDINGPINYIKNSYQLEDNLYLFNEVEMTNDFELISPLFYLKQDGKYIIDDFSDEICLVYNTKEGLYVVAGCSHKGIINILDSIKNYYNKDIIGVIGGIHLKNASDERLNKTIESLKKYPLKLLAVSHCTGDRFIERAKIEFKDIFEVNNTGHVIDIIN